MHSDSKERFESIGEPDEKAGKPFKKFQVDGRNQVVVWHEVITTNDGCNGSGGDISWHLCEHGHSR